MGFFSWRTQDTNESIHNVYSKLGDVKQSIVMIDNQNRKWIEHNYGGYGEFGGKDFYELLAEMNGKSTREEGIKIAFSGKTHYQPNLISLANKDNWEWKPINPKICKSQGYFYQG